ncbi:MAG: hypothetical protein P9M15_01050 [Candidatus Electryoneaceae bacterium]|nr:hypothetical protein [Candidatus Electryoneaceae bacterium]
MTGNARSAGRVAEYIGAIGENIGKSTDASRLSCRINTRARFSKRNLLDQADYRITTDGKTIGVSAINQLNCD